MLAVSSEKVVAWELVNKSANKEKLCAFLEEKLIPAMRQSEHVLLDNCRTHHAKVVKKLWEEDSQMSPFIFNPPYNPDSNPVEMVFAVVKRYLRKLRPSTKEDMELAIGECIRTQLADIFRHALKKNV